MKAMTPDEHRAQLETFVDFFVREFMAEVWYIEEEGRGNLTQREASTKTLFFIACGIITLVPVPGNLLFFLTSAKLLQAGASLVGDRLPAELKAVVSEITTNKEDIRDAGDDVAAVRAGAGAPTTMKPMQADAASGTMSAATPVSNAAKPIDPDCLAELARWLGHKIAQRYEHLLIERLSLDPEKAIVGLARFGARRCLSHLASARSMEGSWDERVEQMLTGIIEGEPISWVKRPLKALAKKHPMAGRDILKDTRFYAEEAYALGGWYQVSLTGVACKTDPGHTSWLKKPHDTLPKYGYIRGEYTKANSKLLGRYAKPVETWLAQRHYQPVNRVDIEAYLSSAEVLEAKTARRIAAVSFNQFLTINKPGFPEYGVAVFKGDLKDLDLSCGNFNQTDFSGSEIAGDVSLCSFAGARLYGVIFQSVSSLPDTAVNFSGSQLGFSNLQDASFKGEVDFTQANLTCVDLTNSRFGKVRQMATCWYKARLTGVSYDGIIKTQAEQLAAIKKHQTLQAAQFTELDCRLAALEKRTHPLIKQSELASLPCAGAGAGVSMGNTPLLPEGGDHYAMLLAAQVDRESFLAHSKQKLYELDLSGRAAAEQVDRLQADLERVESQCFELESYLQSLIDDLWHRVDGVELQQADHTSQLNELQLRVEEISTMSFSARMPAEEAKACLEKRAIAKILDEYVTQLSQQEQSLNFYVRPDVVETVPGNKTPGEYMLAIEQGDSSDEAVPLMDEIKAYLESCDEVMLLLGEPGAGKSLFAWYSTQSRLAAYNELLQGLEPTETPWLPVVIDLKNYRLSELKDLLPTILKKVCCLHQDELKAIQNDNKPEHRLLVVLDGFDELKQMADGAADIEKAFEDIYAACGSSSWRAGQVKLIVTCRVRELQDRYLERQYFGHGEDKRYRRRILLPFSHAKIGKYLAERTQGGASSELDLLPVEDYQAVLEASSAVKEMVRNPFVLRLFVEALPGIHKSGIEIKQIKRYDIYQGFVRQWFEREVRKLNAYWQRELEVGKIGVPAVAQRFEQFASVLANEMYRHNSLVVDINAVDRKDDAFMVWAGFERQLLNQIKLQAEATLRERYQTLGVLELDELEDEGITDESAYISKYLAEEKRRQRAWDKTGLVAFRRTSPLRQSGERYSFIHKSFYEYFIARGLIQTASNDKPLEGRVREVQTHLSAVPGHESRRLWQEPEAIDFVCEYWAQASRAEKDQLKETWFAVIEATKGHPEHGVSGGNAATLLNWVNISMTYKQWQGVHLPGADLRNAYLEGSDLSGADLNGAWLGRVQANQVDLCGANLTAVEFSQRPSVGLQGSCNAIAYHPTKNRVAVAEGTRVRQYDFNENRWLVPPLEGHNFGVTSVSYSGDGEWLATGSGDATIRQWDAESGEMRGAPLKGHAGTVTSVSYSDDGQWLASGSLDRTIRQWRAASGELRGVPLEGHTGTVTSVSYSSNGEWLASGSRDKTTRQWDAVSGELRGAPLQGHTDAVTSVSYSIDGKWLASGSGDGAVRQWNAESGELRGAPLAGHTDWVRSVSYSPDGEWLASGSNDRTIRQWNVASGEARGAPLVGHTDTVTSVSYSGDGRWLASGSDDGTIRRWDAACGEKRGAPHVGHTGTVTSVSYSRDGEWLASGSGDRTIRQWGAASGEMRGAPLAGHTDWVRSVCYSVDGEWLASGGDDGTIRQWRAASEEMRGAPFEGHTDYVTSVSYSVDGKWLASGSGDGTVRQWDPASGKVRGVPLEGHTDYVTSVSYSGDGEYLASGSGDGTVRQWDPASGEMRGVPLNGHTDWVRSVSYCASGKWLASGSDDGTIRQWRVVSGEMRSAPLEGHTDVVTSVSYGEDGEWLASGSRDKTIRQWRAETGELRGAPLVGHTGEVTSMSYSGDGKFLASGSDDGTVRVWWREIDATGGRVSGKDERGEVWRLAWGAKSSSMQLSAQGMRLAGATGLEPHQLELLRQHGYESEDDLASDDGSEDEAIPAGVEESKTAPPEETAAEVEVGLGAGLQVTRVGLFAGPPRGGSPFCHGVEEAKAPDGDTELSGQPSTAGAGR